MTYELVWTVMSSTALPSLWPSNEDTKYRGADKSLARPDWKNDWKVVNFRPTRRPLLPRRPGWTDNLLNCFWVACKRLCWVAVVCFLPGRAKDLSAPWVTTAPTSLPLPELVCKSVHSLFVSIRVQESADERRQRRFHISCGRAVQKEMTTWNALWVKAAFNAAVTTTTALFWQRQMIIRSQNLGPNQRNRVVFHQG